MSDEHELPHESRESDDTSVSPMPAMSPKYEDAFAPIRGYFSRVWKILTQPSSFFRGMPVSGGVSGPLAFALITHWIGAAIAYLWQLAAGGLMTSYWTRLMQVAGDVDNPGRSAQLMEKADRIKSWFVGTGAIIANPFLTLASILFVSLLVYVGARIFVTSGVTPKVAPGADGAPREVTFESALRIVCFGRAPSILQVIPIFGGFVGSLYIAAVTVIGAREVYRVSTPRATLVALFPQLLLLGFVSLFFFAIVVALLKFVALSF